MIIPEGKLMQLIGPFDAHIGRKSLDLNAQCQTMGCVNAIRCYQPGFSASNFR